MHLSMPFCDYCREEVETILHVLRECSQATTLWINVVPHSMSHEFFHSNLREWIHLNVECSIKWERDICSGEIIGH